MAAASVLGLALLLSACGSDGDNDAQGDGGTTSGASSNDSATEGATGGGTSGGAGTLSMNGEEIELGPGRCYLEEQPSAAGGGSILLTAQAQGTDASGADVRIDFTRYSEDSQFAGDDVNINVGPLGDSTSSSGTADIGTVQVDDKVVSATGFPLDDSTTIDFTIDCG